MSRPALHLHRWGLRLYRWGLRLYPLRFRLRWGEEMERSWQRMIDSRRGLARAWVAGRGLADLFRGALRERSRARRRPLASRGGPPGPPPPGGGEVLHAWWRDGRHAARQMLAQPLFVLVTAGSLALGIGANTAVFSVANAVLLRPLPGIEAPDRVVELGRGDRGRGFDTFAWPDLVDLDGEVAALAEVAAYSFAQFSVADDDGGRRAVGFFVTPSYFSALGVRPARGRLLRPTESQGLDAHPVVVVSHRFWRDRMGGDPEAVGSTLRLNRLPYTVVGVTESAFRGHIVGIAPDVYVPLTQLPSLGGRRDEFGERGSSWLQALGRLSDEADLAGLNAQLDAFAARLAEAYPATNESRTFRAIPLGPVPGGGRAGVRVFMAVLLGMVGLILLVTCTNVAGMLLARAISREREIAVRVSVGASRGAVVRMLTVETLLLFLLGGGLGVALAVLGVGRIRLEALPVPIPLHLSLAPDARVLAFALGITLVTGLVFGLLPAARATRVDPARSLRDEGRGGGRGSSRLRSIFAGTQVGLSLILLVTAALFVRSLQRASAIDAGFEPRGAWTTSVDLDLEGYGPEEGRAFQQRLRRTLEAESWVEAASLSNDLPLDLASSGTVVIPEGWSPARPGEGLGIEFNQISPGYFETLGVRVLRGRGPTDADTGEGPRVAMVSEGFARLAWPDRPALGRTFTLGVRTETGREEQRWEVVGVVADVKNQVVTETPEPFVYFPLTQRYTPSTQVVVRTALPAAEAVRRLRETLLRVDPSLSLGPVASLESLTSIGILPQRIAAALTTALGLVALLLSGLGIYGVVSFTVARRRREIGIRMALGADAGSVVRRVLAGGLAVAVPGLAVGAGAALLVGHGLRALLLDLAPYDPFAFGSVAALLLGVVLLAAWLPARRAARIDPVRSLRSE